LHAYVSIGHRTREQYRVERDVVGTIVPVATGPFAMVDGNGAAVDPAHLCDDIAEGEDALAVSPHFDRVEVPPGYRARR
jgi:hypothetical protein